MNYQRLFEILPYRQATYGDGAIFTQKEGLRWQQYNGKDCERMIDQLSLGLLKLELRTKDKVAIIADQPAPIWNFLDFAMQQIGVISVPIYSSVTDEELLFILNNTQIKYCFVETRELFEKVSTVRPSVLSLKKTYTYYFNPDLPHWEEILIETNPKLQDLMFARRASVHPEDIATVVYTAGTTGMPKGVPLSHRNLITTIQGIASLLQFSNEKTAMSFSPLSAITDRAMVYLFLSLGMNVYYPNPKDTLLKNLQEAQPNYIATTPRLLQKVYDDLISSVKHSSGLQQQLLQWAVNVGERYSDWKFTPTYWLQLQLAYLFVFRRWRRVAGRKIEGIIVSQGPLQNHIGSLFSAIGFNVREGYGLTETASFISLNCFEPDNWKIGTVGIPLPNVQLEIRQVDRTGVGEIVVKGENVFQGYYNDTSATQEAFTEDGWFITGDLGQLEDEQFLKITDRKQHRFLTQLQQRIYPIRIETMLCSSPYIERCIVIGAQRPYLVALLIPNFQLLKRWCLEQELEWSNFLMLVLHPKVQALYQGIIAEFNQQLSEREQLLNFLLINEYWTEENQLLTPNKELRRATIEEKYQREIEALYEE